ncbi:helix-turn-helix transcriptional regulator [Lysobacter enzymogenes]|nr:helix-turn-helix transcriptional regulator [Lysobacter enzymogenes]
MPPGYLSAPDGAIADRPKATRVTSSETARDYVRFQLLDGAAGMGDGVENSDYPEVIREVDIAGWEVRRKLGFLPRPGRIKLLTGRGPSMRPMIDNGDVCMVDTEVHAFVGDAVYVINVGGETLIKMLQMRGDGLYVVSANVDYPAYKVDRSELFVGGRVVSVLGMKSV